MIHLNEINTFPDKVLHFQSFVDSAVDDIRSSYEVLKEQESNDRYQLALSYMSMSWQSHLEAKKLYTDPILHSPSIEYLFKAYNVYKATLKRIINGKEQNTEYLDEAYNELIKRYHALD